MNWGEIFSYFSSFENSGIRSSFMIPFFNSLYILDVNHLLDILLAKILSLYIDFLVTRSFIYLKEVY